jgi:UDP-glucuronate decarboxylase
METGDGVVGPVNLGNPEEFTIRQLAEIVVDITGSASKIVHRPLPTDDPKQRQPEISKAQFQTNAAATACDRRAIILLLY